MAGAFLKAQWDTSQLFVAFHQFHPVLNGSVEVLLQDGGHAFRGKRFAQYAVRDSVVDNFSECGDFDWLYQNVIRL